MSIWADAVLFYVAEGLSSSPNNGLLIWRKDLISSLSPERYTYNEGSPDQLTIYSFDSTSATEIYIGFKNIARNKIAII